jgi:hypothetical protein
MNVLSAADYRVVGAEPTAELTRFELSQGPRL